MMAVSCALRRIGPLTDYIQLLLCRIAHKMKLEEALRDPVKNLPHEVLSMIFSMLEFKYRM
jgi:hypothetical protein